jgi:hypothetical protein
MWRRYSMSCCTRQTVVTPDTDWFSNRRPYLFFKVSVFTLMWNPSIRA